MVIGIISITQHTNRNLVCTILNLTETITITSTSYFSGATSSDTYQTLSLLAGISASGTLLTMPINAAGSGSLLCTAFSSSTQKLLFSITASIRTPTSSQGNTSLNFRLNDGVGGKVGTSVDIEYVDPYTFYIPA